MTKRNFETLKNPPAIEAVLDITVNEVANFNINKLCVKGKDGAFKKRFPKMENVLLFEGMFATGNQNEQNQVSYRNRQLGYSYKSPDEKSLCQFRANGFSYNRLQPYLGWETFVKEGMVNWSAYLALRKNIDITRIGLRFINMITIADLSVDLSKHFHVVLSSPTGVGKPKHLKYQYIVDFPDIDCIGIVNFGKMDDASTDSGSFVLDIDIIKQNLSGSLAEKKILQYLEEMREAKNSIFFGTLTPQTLKAYK